MPSGSSDSAELTLTNTGAGGVPFVIDETPFPLTPQDTAGGDQQTRASRHRPRSASCRCGRSRRRGVQTGASIDAPPWFGGADLPGGLVRYGHAQCDGNTTSTYVFAGVDGTFSVTNNSWRYDADSNTWNALAPIPEGGEGPTAVCCRRADPRARW